jgi:hypothetical protein
VESTSAATSAYRRAIIEANAVMPEGESSRIPAE